jgi:dsRNA-specific ribonuclease
MQSGEESNRKIISLPPPAIHSFLTFARLVKNRVIIVSPFITTIGIKYLLQVLPETTLTVDICSRFDKQTFFQRSSEYSAFSLLNEWNTNWKVSFYKMSKLHAKIFIFDDLCIVTSANLTHSGLRFNYEFGIAVPKISLIDQLNEHIKNIFDEATKISLDKIEEISLSAGKRLIGRGEAIDETIFPSQPQLNREEEQEPNLPSIENEEELDRLNKFELMLENILGSDIGQLPLAHLEVFNEFQEVRANLNDVLAQEALQKYIETIDSLLDSFASDCELPKESKADLFYNFVHRSFLNKFKPDLFSDLMHNRQNIFKDIGLNVLKLFHAHNCFSGNYLWQEEIKFFVVKTNLIDSWFRPRFILEELGGRWCIHFGDLKYNWEENQAQKLIGILFFWNKPFLWKKLNSFLDSDAFMANSSFESSDAKTTLQEILQEHIGKRPTYELVEQTGYNHNLEFTISVSGLGCSATGKGRSIKSAEQAAAKALLKILMNKNKIEHAGIVKRRQIGGLKSYSLEDYYYERLNSLIKIIPLKAWVKLIDCALTTPRERHLCRNRRSNEKLAFVGSILRDIYFRVLLVEEALKKEVHSISLSAGDFVLNFSKVFQGWEDFVTKYYKNATGNELASVCESLLAVAWVSGGWEGVEPFYDVCRGYPIKDFKTALQAFTQSRYKTIPAYHCLKETGPGHAKHFLVEVRLGDRPLAQGEGLTKQKASQIAARLALESLKVEMVDGEGGAVGNEGMIPSSPPVSK